MSSIYENFKRECKEFASNQFKDTNFKKISKEWLTLSEEFKYSYNFEWLGRPIIQYPQDIVATQEIIFDVKPDLIIETGIAHGGSLIFSSSQLCILDVMEGIDPRTSSRKVIGIDIDIRTHNRNAIDNHPLSFKIEMIEGSSIDEKIVEKVKNISKNYKNILVFLDSNHDENHVLGELNAYANLVSKNSYCIVYDTSIEEIPQGRYSDRSWDVGNNPMSAIKKWLPNNPNFEINKEIDEKLMISDAPHGYLRRRY